MRPIAFMRLREGASYEEALNKIKRHPSKVIVQFKYDGFKVLATNVKGKIIIFSRRGTDITNRAPEIAKALQRFLKPGDSVLGEMVYHLKNKQSLQKLQSILHSKKKEDALRKTKEHGGNLIFHVYDILELQGRDVSKKPLEERLKIISSVFPSKGNVRLVQSYPLKDSGKALRASLKCGGEGLVIKPLDSRYKYRAFGKNEPFGDWWKYKPKGKTSNKADVILSSYTKGKEKYIFEAYQKLDGKWVPVGKLSGLDKKTEKFVKNEIDKGNEVVVEVSYQTRLASGKLRHMGWSRLRPDKPVQSATVRTNPARINKMAPKYVAYLVMEEPSKVVFQEYSSEEFVVPYQQAYMQSLQAAGEGQSSVKVMDEKQFKKFAKKSKKKVSKKKSGRKKNPRRSLVKDALKFEALRYVKFEDFANRYWNSCARGIYWYPTNESKFYIGKSQEKLAREKKFAVFCNPGLALRGLHENAKYLAELNVNKLSPSDMKIRRGDSGSEVLLVNNLDMIEVMRVIDAESAKRAFRYQQSLLPSSKDQLMLFWANAWRDYENRKKEQQEKLIRAREREARRLEKLEAEREQAEKKYKKKKAKKAKKAKRKNPSHWKGKRKGFTYEMSRDGYKLLIPKGEDATLFKDDRSIGKFPVDKKTSLQDIMDWADSKVAISNPSPLKKVPKFYN